MKVFITNYDGRNRALVAAKSQKAAAHLIGTSLYDFRRYSSVTSNEHDIETAMSQPGIVFLQAMKPGATWVKRERQIAPLEASSQ